MSLFENSFVDDNGEDLFGSLASSQNALVSARKDAASRQQAESQKSKSALGGFASSSAGVLGALGGLASVIPGGQMVGAGLGVLGAIVSLLK